MTLYRIIGNMTGNSMDAIDLVFTEFDDTQVHDVCSFSLPYDKTMQERMEDLRTKVFQKTRAEIESLPDFDFVHDLYIRQIADCVNQMCELYHLDKRSIDAIGFHGKTLDHNPPSKAKTERTSPYTLQIGSGQMLADLTGIPVVYDFRSDPLMAGFESAPLVPPHNAHIAAIEGDGCYYNGGNTSNFSLVTNGMAQIGADAGPFNEYTDNYIRRHTDLAFDKDGLIGSQGYIIPSFLQTLFDIGRDYYEKPLPKSGDPSYYHKEQIFTYAEECGFPLADVVRTFEYFAAYIATQALTLVPSNIKLPHHIILFGGGWKNPVVRNSFESLLRDSAFVLPEHTQAFEALRKRFSKIPQISFSQFGDYMEARLFADLARYKLENKAWPMPEIVQAGKSIVFGRIAYPLSTSFYTDKINRAAKGWKQEKA